MKKVVIFDDMTQCTEEEVSRLLPLVSEQRRRQAMKCKHLSRQFACLKSYMMLKAILVNFFGFNGNFSFSFDYNEHGKPLLQNGPHFSMSHCRNAIAVAVSDNPIGIDVESIRKISEGLIKKTMNPKEIAEISGAKNRNETFISLWTKKEAIMKMLGTGITDNIRDILCDETADFETFIYKNKGYICSMATNRSKN